MKLRKLLFTTIACVGALTYASAQTVRFVNPDDYKTEIPNNSVMHVYLNDPTDDNSDPKVALAKISLAGDKKMIDSNTSYRASAIKLDHKGDADWGIAEFCWNQCTPVDFFGDEYIHKTTKVIDEISDELYSYNDCDIHYTVKGKYVIEEGEGKDKKVKVVTSEVFHSLVKFEPVRAGAGNTLQMHVFVENKKFESTEAISLDKVSVITSEGGFCIVNYSGAVENVQLDVFDICGNRVHSAMLNGSDASYKLPNALNPGMHMFRLSSNGKTLFVQKVMIK